MPRQETPGLGKRAPQAMACGMCEVKTSTLAMPHHTVPGDAHFTGESLTE